MIDFQLLYGMDAMLIVPSVHLLGGKNNFLPIVQTINFDLIFIWVQYFVFNWTIYSWNTYPEDTEMKNTYYASLFPVSFINHFCSFACLDDSKPPAHFQCESIFPELPALIFTVTFSAKVFSLKYLLTERVWLPD